MRLFSFIWIIIIMAAYLVPCSDVPIMEGNAKYESVKNTTDNLRNKTDECSPFCSCACCSLPTVAQTLIVIAFHHPRSEERRVGKECVITCRSRGSPYN